MAVERGGTRGAALAVGGWRSSAGSCIMYRYERSFFFLVTSFSLGLFFFFPFLSLWFWSIVC